MASITFTRKLLENATVMFSFTNAYESVVPSYPLQFIDTKAKMHNQIVHIATICNCNRFFLNEIFIPEESREERERERRYLDKCLLSVDVALFVLSSLPNLAFLPTGEPEFAHCAKKAIEELRLQLVLVSPFSFCLWTIPGVSPITPKS